MNLAYALKCNPLNNPVRSALLLSLCLSVGNGGSAALPNLSQSSTATVLGARAGERKEGAEESRKAPRKELCFPGSCEMSRSLSHGQHSQARNKVYISMEAGESQACSGTSNTSASLPIVSGGGELVSG